LEQKLHSAQATLSGCKAWLDALPARTMLKPVTIDVDGHDLEEVRAKREQPRPSARPCAPHLRRPPTSSSASGITCTRWHDRRSPASAEASG
jgi:hypothetical protein